MHETGGLLVIAANEVLLFTLASAPTFRQVKCRRQGPRSGPEPRSAVRFVPRIRSTIAFFSFHGPPDSFHQGSGVAGLNETNRVCEPVLAVTRPDSNRSRANRSTPMNTCAPVQLTSSGRPVVGGDLPAKARESLNLR